MKREQKEKAVLRFDGTGLNPVMHVPAAEFPVELTVNGRFLVTLVASPHDLQFLVAGFLRTQGFVTSLSDILALSVCRDSGRADVRIAGEIPKDLAPALTSGCGTGVAFSLAPAATLKARPAAGRHVHTPEDVFSLMESLARLAKKYESHGGIHSTAAGDGGAPLLFAEDLGRHNTLDRIAGEALLKQVDLAGKILVTSGRVSSEMAAKAAVLGIAVIASRTSPTDMAVRICEERAITLLGYVRGRKFNLYTHPEGILLPNRSG
jgi:FdhD protein